MLVFVHGFLVWSVTVYSLYNLRRDDLAGTAPCGEAVEHHQALLVQRIIELLLRFQVVYAFVAHGC